MTPLAVYVHTPFCPSKCGYCDFNSYAMQGEIMDRTTRAIVAEIAMSPWRGRPAKTIFFGGGTPTYLEEGQLIAILEAVLEAHPPIAECEITSESNPGTADASKYKAMRAAGFNRISLGAQSFQDDDLIRLERVHKADEIGRAVDLARDAGFDNLNLDLMFALPHQTLLGWRRNLDRALALKPAHLSLYCLTIEPNTAFYKKHLRGQLALPDDEAQVAMYEECLDRLASEGFEQYEISNFAMPGQECRHNLCYWRGEEYAGYGPGAVGCAGGRRYTNLKHPERYCLAVAEGQPLAFESEELDGDTLRTERIMLGLRLNEGLAADGEAIDEKALRRVEARGWVEREGGTVRLTRAGRHFCSEVALELI
ncbi:MAG TPA: radical SAM family heme chaperone HemW [Fimbriimonadaceae bacterium]|nr:radical SAM family heme chaperone HemW [Fimbriimonadaceae bacterium]